MFKTTDDLVLQDIPKLDKIYNFITISDITESQSMSHQKDMAVKDPKMGSSEMWAPIGLTPTVHTTLRMWQKSRNISNVAAGRGFQESTIITHLAKALEKGADVPLKDLNITPATVRAIVKVIFAKPISSDVARLKPVKEEYEIQHGTGKFNYDVARMVVAMLKHKHGCSEKGLLGWTVKDYEGYLVYSSVEKSAIAESEKESAAEKGFWNTPELVEILLSFLDGNSTANLAEVHDLSLNIVKCPRVWNNFIRRTCPQLQEGIRDDSEIFWWQKELKTTRNCLVMNQDKMQALSTVLDLTKGPQKHEMQMDLLHLLCKRFPGTEKGSLELGVVVNCTCPYQNHRVSELGFNLLYQCNVEQLQIKSVFTVPLEEPTLSVLVKVVNNQPSDIEKLTVLDSVMLLTRQSTDALFSLLERSHALQISSVLVNGDIGIRGWEVLAGIAQSHKLDPPPNVYTWDAGEPKTTREATIRRDIFDRREKWCAEQESESESESDNEFTRDMYYTMQL